MNNRHGNGLRFDIIKAILVLLLLTALVLPAMAADEPTFIWTKDVPKPSWWKWGQEYYPGTPVRGGGYLRTAATRDKGLMNPNHWPVNDFPLLDMIYGRLIFVDGDLRASVPWLAKSWKYEDQMTILMTLRKGVTFHDGAKFDAHAVKYSIDWINDRKNATWSRNWIVSLKSVEVVDDYTIRFRTKDVWAGFFDTFANIPGWMLSPKALKGGDAIKDVSRLKNKIRLAERKVKKAETKVKTSSGNAAKKLAKKLKKEKQKLARLKKNLTEAENLAKGAKDLDEWAVGTNRYMVEAVRPGNYVKVKRNPDWWFGKAIGQPDMPFYDGQIRTVIPENSVKVANLKAGKLDTLDIDHTQLPLVKNDPKFNVWITPGYSTLAVTFVQKKGRPFNDIRLRKAVSHAIDRKAVNAVIAGGHATIASCYFPPLNWAHNPDLKPVKYDPELARKLVKEAGYPNGLTVRGTLYSDGVSRRYGEVIKTMLKMVGINWDIRYLEPVAAADAGRNLEYDLGTLYEGWVKDPQSYLKIHYFPDIEDDLKRLHNTEAEALLEKAKHELDFAKRQQLYWAIEKNLYDNYQDAWVFHGAGISATWKYVQGYNRDLAIAGGEAYWPTHPGWFKNGKRGM